MEASTAFIDIIKAVIGVFGVLGNGLVCVVIAKVPAMRTLTNAIIFNQAALDFLASLLIILRTFKGEPNEDSSLLLKTIRCFLWDPPLLVFILFVGSTFNLVLLTLERYIAIMYPFKYMVYFGKTQVALMMVAVWVIAIGSEGRFVILHDMIDGHCAFTNISSAAFIAHGTVTLIIEYLIPLIIMSFCYIHIAGHLKKTAASVIPGPSTSQNENSMSGSLIRARRNTLKTLFIVFVTYVICWTPNQIFFFLYHLGLPLNLDGLFNISTEILVQLNCCSNPVIYAFKYKQFKKGVRVLLKPCCPRLAVRSDENTVSSIATKSTMP